MTKIRQGGSERTQQTEAAGDGQTSADGVEQILGAPVDVEQVLGAEHGGGQDAHAHARLDTLLDAAKGQVVVLALVIHVPAGGGVGELVGVLGSESQTRHLAAVGKAQGHADGEASEGGDGDAKEGRQGQSRVLAQLVVVFLGEGRALQLLAAGLLDPFL